MSKVTIEMFDKAAEAEAKAVEAARNEAQKDLVKMLKGYDFAKEETALLESLRNLYRIHDKAKSILGDKLEFRPHSSTAAIRGVSRGAKTGGGGGGGGKGEKSTAVMDAIKANGTPMTVGEIAAKLGEPEPNIRQRAFNLTKAGQLVSFKKDGDKFREPGKGERGGYYGLK